MRNKKLRISWFSFLRGGWGEAIAMYKRPIICLVGIFLLFGCEEEEVDYGVGEYRVDWVEVKSPNVFSLLNEQETTLYNTGKTTTNSLKKGDRIVLNYSYTNRPTSEYDYGIRINEISPVICGELKTLPEQEILKLNNDPIVFESVWIGRNFLNISFYLDTNSILHTIELVTSGQHHPDYPDTTYLRFRHNKKDDAAGSRKKVYASFDLRTLSASSLFGRIVVNIHSSNYRDSLIVVSKY